MDVYSSYHPETKNGRTDDRRTDIRKSNVKPYYPATIVWRGIKTLDIFHISVQNKDCGWGGSNEYPHSMFSSENKKNNVYPCKPQFYYIKVGFKGVKIIKACFCDVTVCLCHYISGKYGTQLFFFHDVTETQKLLEGSHFYFNLPVCMEVIKPFNRLILPSHFFFFAIIGSNCWPWIKKP